MNRETAVAIIAGFGWLCFIVALWVNGGLMRKIMKQNARIKELEKPKDPEEPKKPSRVEVQLVEGKKEVLMGWRFHYPKDGRLLITDDKDLVGAVFAPGKWISAIVRDEAPAPKAKETT